jgi:hypothetical protein
VGSEVVFDEGAVIVDPERPMSGLFLILHGELLVQTPTEEYDRGAGQVVGMWEKLDGSEDVRVVAKTEARLLAVDRAAYEAALTG